MFYTKLVISETPEQSADQAYLAVLQARWPLVSVTTTGGTKARRFAAADSWTQTPDFETYDSAASEAWFDHDATSIFPDGTTYYEAVKAWDTAEVAQQFVAAVQALNVPGVVISYDGATDPSAA
jgi:hypothetical protein